MCRVPEPSYRAAYRIGTIARRSSGGHALGALSPAFLPLTNAESAWG